MSIMRVCLGLSLLLVLLSCAKTTTIANYDDTVDFTVYTTFAWQVQPVPTTRKWSAYEALAKQWVREAVEQTLAARGLHKATTSAPDLLLLTAAGVENKQDVYRDWDTYFYGRDTLRSFTVERIQVRNYQEGIISLGMYDPNRGVLVWYGGASREVGSPEDDKDTIRAAVGKLLAGFPPSTSALHGEEASEP